MAINVKHTYSTHVYTTFYSDDGIGLRANDCGLWMTSPSRFVKSLLSITSLMQMFALLKLANC